MMRIAVIGDVHRRFNEKDVAYFNGSDYDLVLFVGDLSDYRHREGVKVARVMARLRKTAVFIPGNHDTMTPLQLLAEIKQSDFWTNLLSWGQLGRVRELRAALGPVTLGGYSTHHFGDLDVIAARPLGMGGSVLHYRPFLRQAFGVADMPASAARLRQCVDAAQSRRLIFLAHNGPYGLGVRRHDIWGCDFLPDEGDFGDVDLQLAVAYAQQQEKRVLAVVAGHMHRRISGGGQRRWRVTRDGIHYVNAARVPRIFRQNGRWLHHHVRLVVDGEEVEVTEQVVAL